MYRKDEEFGGFLGMYLEGVRQASYPMYRQEEDPKAAKRAEAEKPAARTEPFKLAEQPRQAEQTKQAAA